jgi:hypothetical protein
MNSLWKKTAVIVVAGAMTFGTTQSASAHAGFDNRGVVPSKGTSSVVLLRIGHGCTAPDGVTKVGTHSVSAVIPVALLSAPASAAMQIPGFNAVVTPSAEKDAAGVSVSNTIAWTAKDDIFDVNPVGFAEFGIRGNWATAGKHWIDTTQVCRIATKTVTPAKIKTVTDPVTKAKIKAWFPAVTKTSYQELKISWSVHDSAAATVLSEDKTAETGPAPSITIAEPAVK